MSKKLIVALLCLILVVITTILKRENESLTYAGERLIVAIKESPEAVAVFNMDRGVFL